MQRITDSLLRGQLDTIKAIAGVIAASAGTVCAVCGLERLGHSVESSWLGIPAHDYAPRAASAADRDHARQLTRQAYAARCERGLCGAYCQSTHVTQVTPN